MDVPTPDQPFLIACRDARAGLEQLPPETLDCIITSPPYYGQRDYQHDNQIGLEATPEAYLQRLLEVFQAANRALNPAGTLWIVIGDKYVRGQLLGLPWRLALGLQQQGWRLRSDIIWHKPNAMPSPVKSRPTVDHEYIFFLTKSNDYFYDADAIREPHVTFSPQSRMRGGRKHFGRRGGTPEQGKNRGNSNLHDARWDQAFHPQGRNKRTVWSISLSKFREAHFAVFPESLVATCLKAGCPSGGLVCDPFCGSGTTGCVALQHQRRFLGFDCSEAYCEMARKRLAATLT